MSFTDRVIALPPAVITILFVLMFVGGGVAINVYPLGSATEDAIFSGVMLLLLCPTMLWHYSLYRAASNRNSEVVGHSGRRGFFFFFAIAGYGATFVLFPRVMRASATDAGYSALVVASWVATVVGGFSYFAAIWASANALVRFDARSKVADITKTLGTFVLAAYLPIGIWVIYSRIKHLLAAPQPLVS